MMETKSVYVELEDSSELRKNLLEDAAESLKLVKELEEQINRFEKEEEHYRKFKNKIIQIKGSVDKFEKLLPIVEEHIAVRREPKKKFKIIQKKPDPKTEIDILKEEIDDIDRKLKAL